MDPDETATSFIEYVYEHPGQPAEEYAVRLADEMRALVAAEREACAAFVSKLAEDPFINRKDYAELIRTRNVER